MEKLIASGIVTNYTTENLVSQKGTPYSVVHLEIGGKLYNKIMKGNTPKNLGNGMFVELWESPKPGTNFVNREIRLGAPGAAPAPVQAVAPAQQPPRTGGYHKDPEEQNRIMRQWAVSQSIQLVTLLKDSGALTAKVMKDEKLLTPLVGHYANFLFNSVQSGENFTQMPHFTGNINEEVAPVAEPEQV